MNNPSREELEKMLMDCCECILDEFSWLGHLPEVEKWYANKNDKMDFKMNKEMRDEIYAEIHRILEDAIDRRLRDEEESILLLRKQIEHEWIPLMQGIGKRMDAIQSLVENHAIGVQNVYAEVKKVQDALKLAEVKKLVRYIENYDSSRIKKEIEEIHKYMNSDFVTNAIDEFKNFKYELLEILERDLGRKNN